MNSNFSEKHKSLIAVMFCFTFLFGNNLIYAADETTSVHSIQQTVQIKGTITDTNGESIIGASILEKGTANGTISDLDGNFSLNCPNGAELVISYMGYVTQTLKATSKMKCVINKIVS